MKGTATMGYAENLIERISEDPENSRVDVLSNELLREFQRGYPIDKLRDLLRSDDPELVGVGAWIMSELAEECIPLLDEVPNLLKHTAKKTRFWTLDCLYWEPPQNAHDIVCGIQLLEDDDEVIRWKALELLSRFSRGQLSSAAAFLQKNHPQSPHLGYLEWMLSEKARSFRGIAAALHNTDPLSRKYGVVAAARLIKHDVEPLIHATSSDDTDVTEFAASALRSRRLL